MKKIIHRWYSIIGMPKRDLEWHKADIADEMQELKEARGLVHKWSAK
jgi:hypothetical protein